MGRKPHTIHPTEKSALSILYKRFTESGMTLEKFSQRLSSMGKTTAFASLKGTRGTTISELEDLCTALGIKMITVLKQAEDEIRNAEQSPHRFSSPTIPTHHPPTPAPDTILFSDQDSYTVAADEIEGQTNEDIELEQYIETDWA